jgi:chromosomal replication initiation ATPase DnaA
MKTLRDIVRDLRARGLWEPARQIAEKHGVNVSEVLMRRQHRPIALARHELWAHAHTVIPSYPLLGEIFDRDQSSISAGVRAHRDMLAIAAIDRSDAAQQDATKEQLTLWGYTASRSS